MKKNGKLGLIGRKRLLNKKQDEKDISEEEQEIFEEKEKKELCEVCKKEEYKYNCPKCKIKSCSVSCVKAHKKKYGCDGEKDKFKKVTKQTDYNEQVFHRDVNFLNNAINEINMSNKKVFNLTEYTDTSQNKIFKTFKRILKKFRNINYFKSPMIMECNKYNKSYTDTNLKKIFWTIKFNFLDEKLYYISNNTFDGDETNIKKIIEYLNNNKESIDEKNVGILNIIKEDEWYNKYNFYIKMDIFSLSLEQKKKLFNYNKYYFSQCDLDTNINELLQGKNVYEFPEFYLIKKN